MLDGDAPTEPCDALDVAIVDGFGVIKKPIQFVDREIVIDLFEDVQCARYGLVVSGMQAPRPFVLRQETNHKL